MKGSICLDERIRRVLSLYYGRSQIVWRALSCPEPSQWPGSTLAWWKEDAQLNKMRAPVIQVLHSSCVFGLPLLAFKEARQG